MTCALLSLEVFTLFVLLFKCLDTLFKLCIFTTPHNSALLYPPLSILYSSFYFFFFSSSNLLLRSSKSTSSPPAELDPTVLSNGGKLAAGTDGNSGRPSIGEGPWGPGGGGVGIPPPGCWGYGVLLYWGGSVDRRRKITIYYFHLLKFVQVLCKKKRKRMKKKYTAFLKL